jgi:flagellar basal-body rod modification protein FlgD
MNVNPTAQSSAANQTTNSAASVADGTDTFLTLLMTQLKTQDPFSPMDPTQMVTQLAQFNSLSALMQIQQSVQTLVDGITNSNSGGAATGAGGH